MHKVYPNVCISSLFEGHLRRFFSLSFKNKKKQAIRIDVELSAIFQTETIET